MKLKEQSAQFKKNKLKYIGRLMNKTDCFMKVRNPCSIAQYISSALKLNFKSLTTWRFLLKNSINSNRRNINKLR